MPCKIPLDEEKGNKIMLSLLTPADVFGEGWKFDSRPCRLKVGTTNGNASKFATLSLGDYKLKGEDRLDRLSNSGRVHLGLPDAAFYSQNPHLIPPECDGKMITFDAKVLLDPFDIRCVVSLCQGGKKWYLRHDWLSGDFGSICVPAVLAE